VGCTEELNLKAASTRAVRAASKTHGCKRQRTV